MRNNTKSWLPDSGEYRSWIAELKRRYRVTQIKAAMSVNTALLEYYWNLGKDISERYADAAAYGMFDLFHVGHLRLLQRARSVVRKELFYHGA